MTRTIHAALFATSFLTTAALQAAALPATLAKAMDGTRVPAMGVLTIKDDRVSAEAVRGVRRNDGTDPVRPTDVWHIGSDGKAMTDTMIARLVDRGVLSWTTPLETMLPELADTMQPQYRTVTLAQLLSHHSGLPHDIADEKALQALMWDQKGTLTQQRYAYVARALRDAPVGPAGEFNYSNTGLLIGAVIAERATGKSFEELMREEVFRPLGMNHVGFGVTHSPQPVGHINGHPAKLRDANPEFFAPAGNMYMPLTDWARFCIDQLKGADGHGKLLKAATYRFMQAPQPGGGDSAIGWGVEQKIAGRRGPVLEHGGSDGTWFALVALFPRSQSGALVVANAGDSMGADKATVSVIKSVVPDLAPPIAGAADDPGTGVKRPIGTGGPN